MASRGTLCHHGHISCVIESRGVTVAIMAGRRPHGAQGVTIAIMAVYLCVVESWGIKIAIMAL